MATWSEFATAEPEMAARAERQFAVPIGYLATVRRDGSPRVHPVSPIFANGRLFVAIENTSPKRHDLARIRRYALHALPPPLNERYDEFEFYVAGDAVRRQDADVAHRFGRAAAAGPAAGQSGVLAVRAIDRDGADDDVGPSPAAEGRPLAVHRYRQANAARLARTARLRLARSIERTFARASGALHRSPQSPSGPRRDPTRSAIESKSTMCRRSNAPHCSMC